MAFGAPPRPGSTGTRSALLCGMRFTLPICLALLAAACGSAQDPSPTQTEPTQSERETTPPDTASSPSHDGDLLCEPVNYSCRCTWDCALVREVDGVFVRLDSEGEQQFVRDDCTAGRCSQVCEGERCTPALVMESNVCTESCPPARAPYTCARVQGESADPTGRPCQQR